MRTANSLKTPIGIHWTIQSVITKSEPERGRTRKFGFAISDDGSTAFIPHPVISGHDITQADVGAGFTAPMKAPSANAGPDAYPQIQVPLTWDGWDEERGDQQSALIEKMEQLLNMEAQVSDFVRIGVVLEKQIKDTKMWMDEHYPEVD